MFNSENPMYSIFDNNKLNKTLFFVITLFLFTSCEVDEISQPDEKLLSPGFHSKSISIDLVEREYILYVPSSGLESDKVYPFVFLLHGHGSSNDVLSGQSGTKSAFNAWKKVADDNSLILCYPNGTKGSDNTSGWNDCRQDATKLTYLNDSKFLSELIALFIESYLANQEKIYFCGVSNGGFMSMRMAIEHPDKITAVAIINAQMAKISECGQPNTPMPILIMNGTKDNIVPYNGGDIGPNSGFALSTDSTVNLWVELNNTALAPDVYEFPDLNTQDKSNVIRELYTNTSTNNDVMFYKMIGAGHTEPSIAYQYSGFYEILVGYQNHDIEMAHEVWSFFSNK